MTETAHRPGGPTSPTADARPGAGAQAPVDVRKRRPAGRRRPPTPTVRRRRRVRRWLQRSDWVLAAVALLFLIGYAWPILQVGLPRPWHLACDIVVNVSWFVFLVDYLARLFAAIDRRVYFRKHLADLAIVALPILKPLRLLRVIMLLRILNRRTASSLQGRVPTFVAISAATLVFCGALAVLQAERYAPGSNIHTFGDAIWWAIVTVTTVGYGDYFPVTFTGRVVAVGLMISGVALIGVVTASFAAWFIDRVRSADEEEDRAAQAATARDLDAIVGRLDTVTRELVALRAAVQAGTATPETRHHAEKRGQS